MLKMPLLENRRRSSPRMQYPIADARGSVTPGILTLPGGKMAAPRKSGKYSN
jgi:hypothetical protein